jgi:hypothetical protein
MDSFILSFVRLESCGIDPEKCANRPFWIEDRSWDHWIELNGTPGGGFVGVSLRAKHPREQGLKPMIINEE